MAVDLIRGSFGVADDTGSGGPAAISASTYGYQSVNLDHDTMSVDEWVAANPDAVWIVEMYRDGELIGTVATDSSNVSGRDQVQPADGSRQYGTGIWWSALVPPSEFEVGDKWIVYGWASPAEQALLPPYPPDRFY